MKSPRPRPSIHVLFAILTGAAISAASVTACSNSANSTRSESAAHRAVTRGLEATKRDLASNSGKPRTAETASEDRAAATLDGEIIGWDVMRPRLEEASGAIILEEVALEHRLERECAARNLTISDRDIEAERTLLNDSLQADTKLSSQRALAQVRASRGLGPVRFASLLRRSAMLRALVKDQARITSGAVELAYRLKYGETLRIRVLTTKTAGDAALASRRLDAGEAFSRVAAELSTDDSAARGGVIDPINPADASYPSALRESASKLTVGETSLPIALDGSYAIITLDERIAPKDPPPIESVRAELEQATRTRQERVLMDELARRLIDQSATNLRALDPSLLWSVTNRN